MKYSATRLAYGDGYYARAPYHPVEFSQEELQDVYTRLETRALYILEGWANVMGFTPDDFAQKALMNYVRITATGVPEEDAYRMASMSVQQEITHLYRKDSNNPTGYFEEETPGDPDDPEDDVAEAELAAVEAAWIYFPPDVVDGLADALTPRELEAVILVFEADKTHAEAAGSMRVSERRVGQLIQAATDKLRQAS